MNLRYLFAAVSAAAAISLSAGERNIPEGYYDSLDGKSGAALKTAAHDVIRAHTAITYGNKTWEVFADSDVREDGTWWDIYSNEKRYAADGKPSGSDMNIEHAVANSWWGHTNNDAYKDIHHLFPADATANNRKSNYPLGEIEGTPKYDNGVTKVGVAATGSVGGTSNYVYEPCDEYKGDNARAYFYMATCYPDIEWMTTDAYKNWIQFHKEEYPTLVSWAQTLLIRWAQQDEVSQKEIDRNEAIYKHQKNRNPFVDLPGLEDYIWGDKSTVAFDLASALGAEPSSILALEEATPFGATGCVGGIRISCETPVALLQVVDMRGRNVCTLTDVENNTRIAVIPGIYIVTAGNGSKPVKVAVK